VSALLLRRAQADRRIDTTTHSAVLTPRYRGTDIAGDLDDRHHEARAWVVALAAQRRVGYRR
jgi:hypothetical protein